MCLKCNSCVWWNYGICSPGYTHYSEIAIKYFELKCVQNMLTVIVSGCAHCIMGDCVSLVGLHILTNYPGIFTHTENWHTAYSAHITADSKKYAILNSAKNIISAHLKLKSRLKTREKMYVLRAHSSACHFFVSAYLPFGKSCKNTIFNLGSVWTWPPNVLAAH